MRGGFRLSVPGLVSVLAFAVLYVLVFGTEIGARWDADAMELLAGLGSPTELDLFDNALDTLWVWVAVIVVVAIVHAARGAVTPVLRVLVVLMLSNGVVLVVRRVLYELDPLGGEKAHRFGVEAFPSAHAAVAISIAVAVVMLAPAQFRRVVSALGGLAAAFIGLASIVEGGHHPSDVFGAFLAVFAVVSFIVVAGANDRPGAASDERWSWDETAIVVGSSIVASAVMVALGAATDLVGTEHAAAAAAAGLLTALAVTVLLGVGRAVSVNRPREARRGRRSTRTSRVRRLPEA